MRIHPTATGAGDLPAAQQHVARDRRGLLAALMVIDTECRDCPTAAAQPSYVREELIRPLATDVGLRGAAESQAQETASDAAWFLLCVPHRRSPGVAVGRHPASGPVGVAQHGSRCPFGARPCRAWAHDAEERAGTCVRSGSLNALPKLGREPRQQVSSGRFTMCTRTSTTAARGPRAQVAVVPQRVPQREPVRECSLESGRHLGQP
jgi:hypothetical protein